MILKLRLRARPYDIEYVCGTVRYPIKIWIGLPVTLTEGFRHFPQSVRCNISNWIRSPPSKFLLLMTASLNIIKPVQ
jgi:hypothetical protein